MLGDKALKTARQTRQYDVFAYAMQCLVIAGRAPKDETHRKSFEFYRNNMRDVMIVAFDELHEKLRSVYAFLNKGPEELLFAADTHSS
nr:Shedu anti-phage system protein SduA domain-containing protein [Rhizobium tubonense]